jgi:serine/threonine-protein kinase
VADPPLDTLTGRTLAGRYTLSRLVATGGMAQVWEATDEVLTRPVAVKLLHPHLAADETFVARFRREAVAVARLSHPSIVSIYDTVSADGVEAIVMELVRGETLRNLLDEQHFLEPQQAVSIAADVADALETAHHAGVIHRDIKPGNILLSDDGRVLVADFGIAKADIDLTASGSPLGTAKYLAPEQVEGAAVDARTDGYSLGVVLYEMLCGRPPFEADTEAGTALARLHQEPMRPRNIRAGIPKPLEEVVLQAMARDPAQRFKSAGAFRAAMLAAVGGRVRGPITTSRDPDATAAVAAVDHTPTGATPPAFVRTERSWLVPTIVITLVAAVLIVVGALVVTGNTEKLPAIGGGGSQAAPAKPVTTIAATSFDPPPGDGSENNGDAAKAIDHDPSTFWQTEGYDSRDIRVKPGVGLYVTLDHQAPLKTLTVESPSNDWSADIYVADVPKDDLAGWGAPVASQSGIPSGTATFDLGGHTGGAVLIWFTNLGDDGPRFHGKLAEVSVTS